MPWFYPATDADARTHFEGLLEAAGDMPAFLYNIPRRTVNDLSAELAGELAAAGFEGMKDSTGDFARHEAYLDATRERDFELYIGSEPLVLRAYREGAAGAITGLAGARPELFVAPARGARGRRRRRAPRPLQAEIAAAKAEVESEGSTVAAVKRRVAAQLAGLPGRAARPVRLARRAERGRSRRPAVVVAGRLLVAAAAAGPVGIAPMLLSSFLIALRSAASARASCASKAVGLGRGDRR